MTTSLRHEFPLVLLDDQPELVTEMLAAVVGGDLAPPMVDGGRALMVSTDLTRCRPVTERRTDRVVRCEDSERSPYLHVMVESQTKYREKDVRRWPEKAVELWVRHDTDVVILAICFDRATRERLLEPFSFGVLTGYIRAIPVLLADLDPLTDPDEVADRVPYAILAAAGLDDPDRRYEVYSAMLEGIRLAEQRVVDEHKAGRTTHLVELFFDLADHMARSVLEEIIMISKPSEYQMPMLRESFAEGEARGQARSIMDVLEARGLTVPGQVRRRVEQCTDTELLRECTRRATFIESADDLFED